MLDRDRCFHARACRDALVRLARNGKVRPPATAPGTDDTPTDKRRQGNPGRVDLSTRWLTNSPNRQHAHAHGPRATAHGPRPTGHAPRATRHAPRATRHA